MIIKDENNCEKILPTQVDIIELIQTVFLNILCITLQITSRCMQSLDQIKLTTDEQEKEEKLKSTRLEVARTGYGQIKKRCEIEDFDKLNEAEKDNQITTDISTVNKVLDDKNLLKDNIQKLQPNQKNFIDQDILDSGYTLTSFKKESDDPQINISSSLNDIIDTETSNSYLAYRNGLEFGNTDFNNTDNVHTVAPSEWNLHKQLSQQLDKITQNCTQLDHKVNQERLVLSTPKKTSPTLMIDSVENPYSKMDYDIDTHFCRDNTIDDRLIQENSICPDTPRPSLHLIKYNRGDQNKTLKDNTNPEIFENSLNSKSPDMLLTREFYSSTSDTTTSTEMSEEDSEIDSECMNSGFVKKTSQYNYNQQSNIGSENNSDFSDSEFIVKINDNICKEKKNKTLCKAKTMPNLINYPSSDGTEIISSDSEDNEDTVDPNFNEIEKNCRNLCFESNKMNGLSSEQSSNKNEGLPEIQDISIEKWISKQRSYHSLLGNQILNCKSISAVSSPLSNYVFKVNISHIQFNTASYLNPNCQNRVSFRWSTYGTYRTPWIDSNTTEWHDPIKFTWNFETPSSLASFSQVITYFRQHLLLVVRLTRKLAGNVTCIGLAKVDFATLALGPVNHDIPLEMKNSSNSPGHRLIFSLRMTQQVRMLISLLNTDIELNDVAKVDNSNTSWSYKEARSKPDDISKNDLSYQLVTKLVTDSLKPLQRMHKRNPDSNIPINLNVNEYKRNEERLENINQSKRNLNTLRTIPSRTISSPMLQESSILTETCDLLNISSPKRYEAVTDIKRRALYSELDSVSNLMTEVNTIPVSTLSPEVSLKTLDNIGSLIMEEADSKSDYSNSSRKLTKDFVSKEPITDDIGINSSQNYRIKKKQWLKSNVDNKMNITDIKDEELQSKQLNNHINQEFLDICSTPESRISIDEGNYGKTKTPSKSNNISRHLKPNTMQKRGDQKLTRKNVKAMISGRLSKLSKKTSISGIMKNSENSEIVPKLFRHSILPSNESTGDTLNRTVEDSWENYKYFSTKRISSEICMRNSGNSRYSQTEYERAKSSTYTEYATKTSSQKLQEYNSKSNPYDKSTISEQYKEKYQAYKQREKPLNQLYSTESKGLKLSTNSRGLQTRDHSARSLYSNGGTERRKNSDSYNKDREPIQLNRKVEVSRMLSTNTSSLSSLKFINDDQNIPKKKSNNITNKRRDNINNYYSSEELSERYLRSVELGFHRLKPLQCSKSVTQSFYAEYGAVSTDNSTGGRRGEADSEESAINLSSSKYTTSQNSILDTDSCRPNSNKGMHNKITKSDNSKSISEVLEYIKSTTNGKENNSFSINPDGYPKLMEQFKDRKSSEFDAVAYSNFMNENSPFDFTKIKTKSDKTIESDPLHEVSSKKHRIKKFNIRSSSIHNQKNIPLNDSIDTVVPKRNKSITWDSTPENKSDSIKKGELNEINISLEVIDSEIPNQTNDNYSIYKKKSMLELKEHNQRNRCENKYSDPVRSTKSLQPCNKSLKYSTKNYSLPSSLKNIQSDNIKRKTIRNSSVMEIKCHSNSGVSSNNSFNNYSSKTNQIITNNETSSNTILHNLTSKIRHKKQIRHQIKDNELSLICKQELDAQARADKIRYQNSDAMSVNSSEDSYNNSLMKHKKLSYNNSPKVKECYISTNLFGNINATGSKVKSVNIKKYNSYLEEKLSSIGNSTNSSDISQSIVSNSDNDYDLPVSNSNKKPSLINKKEYQNTALDIYEKNEIITNLINQANCSHSSRLHTSQHYRKQKEILSINSNKPDSNSNFKTQSKSMITKEESALDPSSISSLKENFISSNTNSDEDSIAISVFSDAVSDKSGKSRGECCDSSSFTNHSTTKSVHIPYNHETRNTRSVCSSQSNKRMECSNRERRKTNRRFLGSNQLQILNDHHGAYNSIKGSNFSLSQRNEGHADSASSQSSLSIGLEKRKMLPKGFKHSLQSAIKTTWYRNQKDSILPISEKRLEVDTLSANSKLKRIKVKKKLQNITKSISHNSKRSTNFYSSASLYGNSSTKSCKSYHSEYYSSSESTRTKISKESPAKISSINKSIIKNSMTSVQNVNKKLNKFRNTITAVSVAPQSYTSLVSQASAEVALVSSWASHYPRWSAIPQLADLKHGHPDMDDLQEALKAEAQAWDYKDNKGYRSADNNMIYIQRQDVSNSLNLSKNRKSNSLKHNKRRMSSGTLPHLEPPTPINSGVALSKRHEDNAHIMNSKKKKALISLTERVDIVESPTTNESKDSCQSKYIYWPSENIKLSSLDKTSNEEYSQYQERLKNVSLAELDKSLGFLPNLSSMTVPDAQNDLEEEEPNLIRAVPDCTDQDILLDRPIGAFEVFKKKETIKQVNTGHKTVAELSEITSNSRVLTVLDEICSRRGYVTKFLKSSVLPTLKLTTNSRQLSSIGLSISLVSKDTEGIVIKQGYSRIRLSKLCNLAEQGSDRWLVVNVVDNFNRDDKSVGRIKLVLAIQMIPCFEQLQAGVHTGDRTKFAILPSLVLNQNSHLYEKTVNYNKILNINEKLAAELYIQPTDLTPILRDISTCKIYSLPTEIKEIAILQLEMLEIVLNNVKSANAGETTTPPIDQLVRLLKLLKLTDKHTMLAYVYATRQDLLTAQLVLLHLAHILMDICRAFNSCSKYDLFQAVLYVVIQRGELDWLRNLPQLPDLPQNVPACYPEAQRTIVPGFVRHVACALRAPSDKIYICDALAKYAKDLTPEQAASVLWYDVRMATSRLYHELLFSLIKDILNNLSEGKVPAELHMNVIVRGCFVWPELRYALNEAILSPEERSRRLKTWRSIHFRLDDLNSYRGEWHPRCPPQLKALFDCSLWHRTIFSYTLHTPTYKKNRHESCSKLKRQCGAITSPQMWFAIRCNKAVIQALGALNKQGWKTAVRKRDGTLLLFLRQYAMFVGRVVVNTGDFVESWKYLPGYVGYIKAFLLVMLSKRVEHHEDAMINTAGSLLRNSSLLCVFIRTICSTTNLNSSTAVAYALDNISYWFTAMDQLHIPIPVDLDWGYFTGVVDKILASEQCRSVANMLWFLYTHYYKLTGYHGVNILGNVLLDRNFARLFFHWSVFVRERFYILLLFRIVEQVFRTVRQQGSDEHASLLYHKLVAHLANFNIKAPVARMFLMIVRDILLARNESGKNKSEPSYFTKCIKIKPNHIGQYKMSSTYMNPYYKLAEQQYGTVLFHYHMWRTMDEYIGANIPTMTIIPIGAEDLRASDIKAK